MKLIDRLFGRKAAELTYDQIANLIDGAGGRTVAGISVTEKSALQVPTVLACVRAIADGCSTPDLHVYREKATAHRNWRQTSLNIGCFLDDRMSGKRRSSGGV